MKFHLAINLERTSPIQDMGAVAQHTLDMVKMADQGGFEIAWAAEHHALEMTIAPNPFQLLTWWARIQIRSVWAAGWPMHPYWHPIKIAGEAALLDLISGGGWNLGWVQAHISANLIGCAQACCKPMAGNICRKCCRSSASFGRAI